MIKKDGILKYFHLSIYNILGAIFLLPFISIFTYGLIGRIVQGDLEHYNRSFERVLSHSFLYANYFGKPILLFMVAILLPMLAVLINLIPLIKSLFKAKS